MAQLFDEQVLMERVDGDMDFLEETIAMLDEDSPTLLREIIEAASRRDAEAITKPAHTLKGMLANFCARSAETAAREVEMMGRENRMVDLEAAVALLEKETKNLSVELHGFIEAARQ